MAPIFEKRSQPQGQTHHREGTAYAHHGSHGKENSSAGGGGNGAGSGKHAKKGLEILDFHESWLEEMEIYKDQMHQKQHHLLGSHNHQHSPAGCHFEASGYSPPSNSLSSATSMQNTGSSSLDGKRASPDKQQSPAKLKPRISIRTMQVPRMNASEPVAAETSGPLSPQLHLKRPRDESKASKTPSSSSNITNHAKKHAHSHKYSARSNSPPPSSTAGSTNASAAAYPLSPNSPSKQNGVLAATASPQKNAAAAASPSKPTTKIIVNQFHASSLLSAHHHEKSKILTQNGLTKSAATAYETSLYASHYMPPEGSATAVGSKSPTMYNLNDNTNYIGVSLAKSFVEGDRSREGSHHSSASSRHHVSDDDPCAAIDDVNDYTDSESEEEYCGYPFYLPEDGRETQQSLYTRIGAGEEPRPPPAPATPSISDVFADDRDTEAGSEKSEYYTPPCILTPSLFPNVPPYLNFSSHAEKGPNMPSSLHRVLKWKLSPVMPKIVKRIVLNSGFRIIKNTTDWMAIWEKHMKSPGFRTIRSHQKYNHMPGSFRIGRKDTLWRSIHSNMKKYGTREFGFMQRSYIMPDDLESLRQAWPKNASKLTKWIVKPPASARGTGIRIVNKWSQFPKDRPLVVQKYIERPLLINDNKFDMRIYVIVTSINPLRIYMYKDGLARFASVKYSSELNSLDDRCMHLTNYSINKFSQNYSKNEDFRACQGHKWTLQSLWSCLEQRGVNTKRLWATLRNLVIKAIISGESGLNRMYRQNVNFRYNCFELFGFDILLDENLIPWLLEVNISPSLHSELPLDLHVKGPLIQAVLNTALYQVPPKMSMEQQMEIMQELKMDGGPLCHDKRIFTTCLTTEEVRKHNQFTNRALEFREEYVDTILDYLLPDDVRCLIISEDEFARSSPLERIFPTADTHSYLKYIDNPRYYNRLLDAWEHRYSLCRDEGRKVLARYCKDGYHLKVSDAAMEKEPNVTLTEIDMLHQKKSDETLIGSVADTTAHRTPVNMSFDSMAVLSGNVESPDREVQSANKEEKQGNLPKGRAVKKS